MTARFVLALFLLAAAIAIALYYPAFGSAWAFDDFEYINSSAATLAGKTLPLRTLISAHDEHFVPAFRLLLLGYLKYFGLGVFVWRVMSVLAYALAGVFVALLAVRYSGSRRAGITAAIVFVAPCGFSSMWIWFSSGAAVPISFAALAAACAVLAWRSRLRLRRIAAGALVLLALLTWSVFAPLALLPAIVDEIERRREGARRGIGAFTLFSVAAMLFILLIPLRLINADRDVSIVRGAPRAIFLAVVAPFRFFFPTISIASDTNAATGLAGAALGIATGVVVLALLVRLGMPFLARVGFLTAIPALAYFCFVAAGRSFLPLAEIYKADRYFFPLLMPIALIAGAIAASIPVTRVLAAVLIIGAVCEVGIHRRALLRGIPHDVYDMHGRRLASLEQLAARLEKAAPIAIPDNILWFEDLHSSIDAAVITHILSDGKRVRLGGAINARQLNAELDAWAREIGEPVPFLRVVNGYLVNLHFTTTVDFGVAPFDSLVVRGFHEWRKPYRWMTRRGELDLMLAPADITLRLAAPISDLRRVHPEWTSIPVRVVLIDEAWGGYTAPLGTIEIKEDGVQTYRLPETAVITKGGLGRLVRIVLECDRVWRPSEVYATADAREHTVQLYSFGTDFYGDTGATVKAKPQN